MKQYYESEVLFQLMERDGLNIPSSVPPYEAEIKTYLIEQVKQAYPKLTDYEAEWLLYNYTKHLPAEFPISSVSDVTEATFENVVPFAYQSAILSGQTLVNLITIPTSTNVIYVQGSGGKNITIYNNYKGAKLIFSNGISQCLSIQFGKMNTIVGNKYLLECDCYNGTSSSRNLFISNSGYGNTGIDSTAFTDTIQSKSSKHIKVVFTMLTDQLKFGHNLYTSNVDDEYFEFNNIRIIEYQEGMENWDIPYFEGMQSVKMPVLTTTGKNLFDKTKITKDYVIYSNGELTKNIGNAVSDYIKIEKNKTYIKNSPSTIAIYDVNKIFIKRLNSTNVVTASNDGYIRCNIGDYANTVDSLQIEEGSVATSYEPYKSNILTVNEDVTLRGIGDVRDTLDCLIGEVTERIGEVVLDGSEDEGWRLQSINEYGIANFITTLPFKDSSKILCDSLVEQKTPIAETTTEGIYMKNNQSVYVRILSSKANTTELFKKYLQSNPITVQYQPATESIKTVVLTTVNEKGETTYFMPLEGTMSVQSSGEIIKPTFDMSVPIEATTQNLASFIDMEMEE